MKYNTYLKTALGSAVFYGSLLTSCSNDNSQNGINVTPEQVEEAKIAGREAARIFVNHQWNDTLQLQEQLIEASAKGARYDSITRLRATYDSAFISTVRTVRPEVAAELEKYQKTGK